MVGYQKPSDVWREEQPLEEAYYLHVYINIYIYVCVYIYIYIYIYIYTYIYLWFVFKQPVYRYWDQSASVPHRM